MNFFGEPWPSGICDDGTQVETPIGARCQLCEMPVEATDQGSFIITPTGYFEPVHRECFLRSALGGIGHLENHAHWCGEKGDPDMGLGYRESALQVWAWTGSLS